MATQLDGIRFDSPGESNRFIIDGFAVEYGSTVPHRSAEFVTVLVDQDRGKHHEHVMLTLTADQADRLARALSEQAERARGQHAAIRDRHEATSNG